MCAVRMGVPALRTESGIEDAGGERGLCVWRGWGVRPLGRAINTDQWERGGRWSKDVSVPGEPARQISGIPIPSFHGARRAVVKINSQDLAMNY